MTNTTFRKTLEIAKTNNINIVDLTIADEVDCMFSQLSINEFECVCAIVKDAYIQHDHISINECVCAIEGIIKDNPHIDITEIDRYDIYEYHYDM